VSFFSEVDLTAKKKRQQDVESGDEILTYVQKFGKNEFYQRILKSDPSPQNYQTKRKRGTITFNKKLRIGIK